MSEQGKYRKSGLRGDRSAREVCREHGISETLFYGWRDQLLEAARERFAGKQERQGERELRRKIAELERTLGRKTTSWRSRENCCGSGSETARRPLS